MADMQNNLSILVLGTADWNQPIATNQHYMVRELCMMDEAVVTFVESLALRRPSIGLRDARRIAQRLRSAVSPNRRPRHQWRDRPLGLTVLSPLVVPLHRGPLSALNRRTLHRAVRAWLSHDGPKLLWTYTPTTYGLEDFADCTVYHCVDLLSEVVGIDRRVIDENELRLSQKSVVAIASSGVVHSHLSSVGFADVSLWPNVADTSIFARTGEPRRARVAGRVIFAGNLSPLKVDYELLIQLAESGLDVRVAGPRAEGGGRDDQQFRSLTNAGVRYLGMLSLKELSEQMAEATVGLIPYVSNAYTLGVSPLKTYEYLAAGLAVVATDLPGVEADHRDIFAAANNDEFVQRVKQLSEGVSEESAQARRQLADVHSWKRRGDDARHLVRKILEMADHTPSPPVASE